MAPYRRICRRFRQEAALSFLKGTKCKVTWSVRDLPDTLKISAVMSNTSSTRPSHHRNFSPN